MGERFCPNITKCPMYAFLERQDFRDCMHNFCLGNHETCQRWILRTQGETVPEDLMPNGQLKSNVLPDLADDGSRRVHTII